MKTPQIYVVVRGHRDFNACEYLAWFFDEDEAHAYAEAQPRSEWSAATVEEVPGRR